MNFEDFNLDSRIAKAIREIGYEKPTPIQQQAIPVVMEGKDVMGIAQTGTGKTAAFMLPILNHLAQGKLKQARVLVVAPTRELAEQIHEETVKFTKHMKVRSVPIYGGVSKGKQISAVKAGTEIIIACPGRLLDLHNQRAINLSTVEYLVLDEADRMCDMGFLPDIKRILKILPNRKQSLFFSATMPKDIKKLADMMLKNPVTVQIGEITLAKTVSHAFYPVPQKKKRALLFALLDSTATAQVLVFTRTKYRARNLARDLAKRGESAAALQGNMSQNQRQKAITGFRDGKIDILVATDIAARGIDVSQISHVVNFDIPDTVDAYTHRIGRTGRAHKTGEAFTFITPDDNPMVRDIERRLKQKIERRTLEDFDYSAPEPTNNGNNNKPKHNRAGGQKKRGGGNSNNGGGRGGANKKSRNGNRGRNSAKSNNRGGSGNRSRSKTPS